MQNQIQSLLYLLINLITVGEFVFLYIFYLIVYFLDSYENFLFFLLFQIYIATQNLKYLPHYVLIYL